MAMRPAGAEAFTFVEKEGEGIEVHVSRKDASTQHFLDGSVSQAHGTISLCQ